MEFDLNLKALKLFGYFIPNEEKSSLFRKFWFCFMFIDVLTVDITCIAYRVMEPYNIISRVWLAFHILSSVQLPYKRFYFTYKMKTITALIKLISTPLQSECEEFNDLEADMRVQSKKKNERFCKMLFIYQLCSLSVTLSAGVFRIAYVAITDEGDRSSQPLFSPIVWPTDPLVLPTYYFIMLWQCTSIVLVAGVGFTADAFLCSLMLAASERAAFLARTAPQALLPGPVNTITPQFRAWVQYHQHYLRVLDQINHIMGPFIFIVHAITNMYIVVYCYALLKFEDISVKAITVFLMTGTLIVLYIYAIAGQKVLNQSVRLRNSVLGVAQMSRGDLEVGGPFCSALEVLVVRISGNAGPEEISGLGFFTVSMAFFSSVLSACFSYLMILLKLE